MKKILGAMTFLSLLIVLTACINSGTKKDKFKEIYDSIEISEVITESIKLPRKTDLYPEASLSWQSSHPQILSPDGTFIRPDEDVNITLELVIQLDGEVKFLPYQTVGKGWENQTKNTNEFTAIGGFAALTVKNRNQQVENKYEVKNELELLNVLKETRYMSNVIIKVSNDLNMGSKHVEKLLKEAGKTDDEIKNDYMKGYYYRANPNTPLLHPTLIEMGVGQMIIDGRDGFMLYSDKGVKINHLTVHIKGNSKDIVFRNLHMTGIWEWDELDKGDYKVNDWDYFTLENVDGVWLDHLTINTSYDGVVDAKGNVQNVTLSWLDLDFSVNDFIEVQFNELEKNRSKYPYYNELRNNLTKEQIMTVAAGQKKGFNFGNTEGGIGFENITVTMHHIYAKNLQDRFPRLRRGDIHMYNVVLDSTDLYRLKDLGGMKVISQGLVPTEQGAVLMENSRFVGVAEAVKTHQASNEDPDFTGRYAIKDSEYRLGGTYYYGSSTDDYYANPWYRSNKNIEHDLDFYFRNYQEVPYQYRLDDAKKITKVFKDNPLGAGLITDFNWLNITDQVDKDSIELGNMIDQSRVEGLETILVETGKKIIINAPILYNFYDNKLLKLDRDYTYFIEHNIDINTPGIYTLTYIIQSMKHDWDTFEYEVKYVVYDDGTANDIYDHEITQEFNATIDLTLMTYRASGKIYIVLNNLDKMTPNEIMNDANVQIIDILSVKNIIKNLPTNGFDYVHIVTQENDKISHVITEKIVKEIVVEIKTTEDFFGMLTSTMTRGRYYILTNDLDFTKYDTDFPYLDSGFHRFQGIFDGSNFALRNIDIHRYSGGIFHTIDGGQVKNLVIENVKITIEPTLVYDDNGEEIGTVSTSDRAAILVGRTLGDVLLENIKIINSHVTTNKNYGAVLIGRIETGSSVTVNKVSIINSSAKSNGNTGVLIGSVDQKAAVTIQDIYINSASAQSADDMVAVLIARLRGEAVVKRVVVIDTNIKSKRNMGGLVGKENSETTLGIFEDIFIDNTNDISEIINNTYGHLVGNLDLRIIELINVWGTKTNAASGLNISSDHLLEDMTAVNESFWTTNFPNIVANENWEIVDGILKLK